MLRSVVVDGPLAMRMRRLRAAREGDVGLQIFTVPQLAARLAGGFARPAQGAELASAVRHALATTTLEDLAPLTDLPGMTRAVIHTLERLWRASIALSVDDGRSRIRDLAALDLAVRHALPSGALAPPDLSVAAIERARLAPRLLGDITFENHRPLDPVWHAMVDELSNLIAVEWITDAAPCIQPASPTIVACADPRAEVVEALRWARQLVSSGVARPEQIAIVAASPSASDEDMLALSRAADLPIHFSHGVPVLTTRGGQACAALADVLERGLSQERVRRVLAHGTKAPALKGLPVAPLAGLHRAAPLDTVEQWERALSNARAFRTDGADVAAALRPALLAMHLGAAGATETGPLILPRAALGIWQAMLRMTTGEGIALALSSARTPDDRDPGSSIVWCPADHLVGAPRPWVRLLGLNSRSWPRPDAGDPLLPPHILALPPEAGPNRLERDRKAFETITARASAAAVLSQARRSAQGSRQAPSDLLLSGAVVTSLARSRTPEHAFSEADRQRARRGDPDASGTTVRAAAAYRARRARGLNAHDGLVRADHPAIRRALNRSQSATSLQRLIRDPLGYMWHYALGWREVKTQPRPLSLDDRAFGDLVHVLLQRTVDSLEEGPGFGRAAKHEIEGALDGAVDTMLTEWPSMRPTPPPVLWQHTLALARTLAYRGLTLDQAFATGTKSWTELRFGQAPLSDSLTLPWSPTDTVTIPGTAITLVGSIDRLELKGDLRGAQITDYKTGTPPKNIANSVLGGCSGLQRAIYAVAVRQHVPDARIRARLVYLDEENPVAHRIVGEEIDDAVVRMAGHATTATNLMLRGICLPGPDAEADWSSSRLALPAAAENYHIGKGPAIAASFAALSAAWRER